MGGTPSGDKEVSNKKEWGGIGGKRLEKLTYGASVLDERVKKGKQQQQREEDDSKGRQNPRLRRTV